MSRCIAEFEMPEMCCYCPCFNDNSIDDYCNLAEKSLYSYDRPEWCPLKKIKEEKNK